MFWKNTLIPTLKESPQEAETVSHKLMLRSGLVRMLMAGVYSYLPLGLKVLNNIERIIREEMDAAGASELLLPSLQPQDLWIRSGRDKDMGEVMIRFTDRRGRNVCLGPTHEEVITDLVKGHISSYKQLPLTLYQIQTKFRDEIRPRFGLIRCCEFVMKDAYSFDKDEEGLDKNYKLMYDAYQKIFIRCGLEFLSIEADSGVMGGNVSHEFMVPAKDGEDIEVGHIFKLGTKYSSALAANFLDAQGKQKPVIMGCYGIGVSRLIPAIIEQNNDNNGIIWPREVSPYSLIILPLDVTNTAIMDAAIGIYQEIKQAGIDALLDDRDERAGVKFKDADLLGITLQVIIGQEFIKSKVVELKERRTNKRVSVDKKDVLEKIVKLCNS